MIPLTNSQAMSADGEKHATDFLLGPFLKLPTIQANWVLFNSFGSPNVAVAPSGRNQILKFDYNPVNSHSHGKIHHIDGIYMYLPDMMGDFPWLC